MDRFAELWSREPNHKSHIREEISQLLKIISVAKDALFTFGWAAHHYDIDLFLREHLSDAHQPHQRHRPTQPVNLMRLHVYNVIDCNVLKSRLSVGRPPLAQSQQDWTHLWVPLGSVYQGQIIVPSEGAHWLISLQVIPVDLDGLGKLLHFFCWLLLLLLTTGEFVASPVLLLVSDVAVVDSFATTASFLCWLVADLAHLLHFIPNN